jgi:putative flavoprotein involved in K+ transport
MQERHDTIVIGGGQAGLAMSAVLRDRGREHVVLERQRVAERWRSERWNSLRFQFPNWSIELPRWRYVSDDPDGFATAAEILRLIEQYATDAPVREHTNVSTVERDGDYFSVTTDAGVQLAQHVVIATGPFQRPRIPSISSDLPTGILQTDPTRYRAPEGLPDGAVLVVGSGASGIQIADELLHTGRRVFLAVSRHRRVPRRFRGRDVYWWLDRMGRFAQTIDSFPDRAWPPSTVVTGVNGGYDVDVRRLARAGIQVVGRVLGAADGRVMIAPDANPILDEADAAYLAFVQAARTFASTIDHELTDDDAVEPLASAVPECSEIDLAGEGITTVVWATGYRYDYGWLKLRVLDERAGPIQQRGVASVPGLYFLGLHWMYTFKSGLLSGVGADAEYLADRLACQPRVTLT